MGDRGRVPGARVIATAGPGSAARVRGYGASAVFDYHDIGWPARVREASHGGRGVGAAVNTARGGAAALIEAVAEGGRLATITGDAPRPERGVTVADVYVRADGARLAALVAALADGMLSLHLGATVPLAAAAAALQTASAGRASGATVLTLSHSPQNTAAEPLATSFRPGVRGGRASGRCRTSGSSISTLRLRRSLVLVRHDRTRARESIDDEVRATRRPLGRGSASCLRSSWAPSRLWLGASD